MKFSLPYSVVIRHYELILQKEDVKLLPYVSKPTQPYHFALSTFLQNTPSNQTVDKTTTFQCYRTVMTSMVCTALCHPPNGIHFPDICLERSGKCQPRHAELTVNTTEFIARSLSMLTERFS